MMQSSKAHANSEQKEREARESKVALPVDLQIELAENRRSLAQGRYEISVRKGRAWDNPKNRLNKMLDK